MSGDPFVATLALVSVVILVAALLSGLVSRWRFPQVALFLLLGAAIGPWGLGLVDFQLTSPVLRALATLGLVLVLFTDAVSVNPAELRTCKRLVLLVLGPGTLITAALIAVAAWGLLGLPPALATILGAALASTDPVMMRDLLRGDVPAAARQALRLESGLNDLVVLPIVLAAMLSLAGAPGGAEANGWVKLFTSQFLLGPLAGAAVGFVAVASLEGIRKRFGIRRDYESLYALGVALAAFAAAEVVNGSGFLAAFAAGLTVAAFDAELCDCFLDYGAATAEMFLLFTFVAFGASLIWTGFDLIGWRGLLFASIGLVARSLVLLPALAGSGLDTRSRRLITWFGPRGLSSLLLVLLPVFAGLEGGERLFPAAALVVLLSVVVHGGALMVTERRIVTPASPEAAGTPGTPGTAGTPGFRPGFVESPPDSSSGERITLEEVRTVQARGERVVLLDVRKERDFVKANLKARGAVRINPEDDVARRAAELALPRQDWLVAYCA